MVTNSSKDQEELISKIRSQNFEIRANATAELAMLGPKAVDVCLTVMKDSSSYVRSIAAGIVGRFADQRGVEPLIDSLKDSESGIRSIAVEGLRQIGKRLKDDNVKKRIISQLVLMAEDKDKEVQESANSAIKDLG
jgi:HEAT repeat protein